MYYLASCREKNKPLQVHLSSTGPEAAAIYLHLSPDWEHKGILSKLLQHKPRWLATADQNGGGKRHVNPNPKYPLPHPCLVMES